MMAAWYRRLRTTHPVYVLAWLRTGVLLAIAAAALLYLLVAIQASSDIATALRTQQAITDVGDASTAVISAGNALAQTISTEDVALTGTGSDYINDISKVTRDLALAAENNGAGTEGTTQIQVVQGQLETYLQLSLSADREAELGTGFGEIGERYELPTDLVTQPCLPAKDQTPFCVLQGDEQAALNEQRDEWPVDPAAFWWALLGPLIIALILAGMTARLLARHFRRHVSPWLWGSLLLATATAVTAGFLNLDDERTQSQDPLAGHPITLVCALLLFFAAGVMAHLAYRRRLADYRFRSA